MSTPTQRRAPTAEDVQRPVYQRPVLLRHQSGLMNKFGRAATTEPLTHIDGVAVAELVAKYGSPLFVFSERTMVERHRELRQAFSSRHPKVRIGWSYKTNYLDAVCRIFHREGAWAEVVSEFEYDKARKLGVAPDHIHFNGPMKSDRALEEALSTGGIVHLDHFDELARAEAIAERRDLRPGVALRINLSVDGMAAWDRFGFNLESGQAMDGVNRILAGDRLRLIGLHCHVGTFVNVLDPYRSAVRKLAAFANELKSRHGVVLEFLDFGGGFASCNTLKGQYLPGEQSNPTFAQYAEAITEGLKDLEYEPRETPTLVLETGRAMVDDAGYLIAGVHANKRLPDGRRGIILDAGVNVLFTSFWYKHDVVPAQPFQGLPEPTVFFGPLCMNIDVMRDTMQFPAMRPGDHVVFRNVGAYNVTQWMQFISYRPAVVLIGQDGRHSLMRRREDLQSILEHEETPPWL